MLATPKNLATAKTTLKKMNAEIDLDCFQYRDYFPKSKKIAQFELLQREKHPDREYPFFNDFAYQWFERKKATWKNSYRNTIQNVLDKYLIPQFGNTLMNEIILSQVDFYRQQLMQMVRADNTRQLSNRRINNLLWLIVSMVSLAAEEYKFEYPLRRYRSLKEEKAESHPMTIKEVEDVKLALGTFYLLISRFAMLVSSHRPSVI